MKRTTLGLLALTLIARMAHSDTLLTVDATAPVPAPETGYFKVGTQRSPTGGLLEINNQYLVRDGKPWAPVMGEFHYTRFPESQWEEQLLKMKAAGIDVVASYIIWQHHEEVAGQFLWTGDRDLRRFVELCAKHHLYFFARVGPWSHAEVRFGGIPDWVVNAMPTRTSDPQYLSYVGRYYAEIGKQLQGLLWKDGGPIIGTQIENEYNLRGPNQGREHIAALKALAIKAGLDTPLYTVTGWDNTVYPAGEVAPVFGGYPDEPWSAQLHKLPPKETYGFRFENRVSGNLGAQTSSDVVGDAIADIPHTPFLGAEYGGGVPTMYRRRPVITPDDIASMLPVQIGSGVNLYGYYMFHGGRNPQGRPSREENGAIGGYNDLPMIGYDFGAPLGQYCQVHPVLRTLRPYHLFLRTYGSSLATMTPRRPDVVPSALDDLTTPRFSVRSNGDSGYLFFSNYIRQYRMADQHGLRFKVKLPGGELVFPSKPVDVPSGAYFIWPFNMNLKDARLLWATAQPITELEANGVTTYVFRAVEGIPVEFAFDPATTSRSIITGIKPGTGEAFTLKTRSGAQIKVVVLTAAQAERVSMATLAGAPRLVISEDDVYFDGDAIELRSTGDAKFEYGVFPALPGAKSAKRDGVFQQFTIRRKAKAAIAVAVEKVRDAGVVPPLPIGGPAKTAMIPWPEVFGRSAAWKLTVPGNALEGVNDVFLQINYKGDVGRLFSGVEMIDDHFYNGVPWEVGLKRFAREISAPLTLTVLPLREDAAIYIQDEYRPRIASGGQIAEIATITAIPEYRLRVDTTARSADTAPRRATQ